MLFSYCTRELQIDVFNANYVPRDQRGGEARCLLGRGDDSDDALEEDWPEYGCLFDNEPQQRGNPRDHEEELYDETPTAEDEAFIDDGTESPSAEEYPNPYVQSQTPTDSGVANDGNVSDAPTSTLDTDDEFNTDKYPYRRQRQFSRKPRMYGDARVAGVIPMHNQDAYCLFRSIIASLCRTRKCIFNKKFVESVDIDDEEKFRKRFHKLLQTQYKPISVSEIKAIMTEAFQKLRVKNPDLTKEIDFKTKDWIKALKKTIDICTENGNCYPFLQKDLFLDIALEVPEYSREKDVILSCVEIMLKSCKIPLKQEAYDFNECKEKLQGFLNRKFGEGKYRIAVMDAEEFSRNPEPLSITVVDVPQKAETLYLAYSKPPDRQYGHYMPIKSMLEFCGGYYCEWCRKLFSHKERHAMHCPYTCSKCGRGTIEECLQSRKISSFFVTVVLASGFVPIVCRDDPTNDHKGCNKVFYNQECYNAHKKRMCLVYKTCGKCHRKIVNGKPHDCDKPECIICRECHPPGKKNCFITPKKPSKKHKRFRICYFDCECRMCGMVQCDGACLTGGTCPVEAEKKRYDILRAYG